MCIFKDELKMNLKMIKWHSFKVLSILFSDSEQNEID